MEPKFEAKKRNISGAVLVANPLFNQAFGSITDPASHRDSPVRTNATFK
jgi:hypothetical protein